MTKRIFLDQNKWIDLSRAYHGRPGGDQFRDVLQLCFARREQGAASFPIAAQHFMELGKRGDVESRKRLATFMAVLSDGDSMASYTAIVPELILRYCQRLAGQVERAPPAIFGKGLSFAFGKEDFTSAERTANPEWVAWMSKKLATQAVLADLLANPTGQEREQMAGHVRLNSEKVAEAAESARLARPTISPEIFEQMLLYRIALSSQQEIRAVCEAAGVDPEHFLGDADTIRRGISAIPPLAVELELIRDQVTQAQRRVHANDMVDIASMSMVIPYCDVVVTERHWAHVCRQKGVALAHNTVVLTDVNDLPTHLGAP